MFVRLKKAWKKHQGDWAVAIYSRRTEQEPMELSSPSLSRSYEVFPSPSMATIRGNEYAWRAFEYLLENQLGGMGAPWRGCARVKEQTQALKVVCVTVSQWADKMRR